MQWVVVTGDTVEAARERALDALGIDETELELEVLDEARTSLFGLRHSPVRVRARVRPTVPRPKVERRNRRNRRDDNRNKSRRGRGGGRGSRRTGGRDEPSAGDTSSDGTGSDTTATDKPASGATASRSQGSDSDRTDGAADATTRDGAPSAGGSRRSRRRRSGAAREGQRADGETPAPVDAEQAVRDDVAEATAIADTAADQPAAASDAPGAPAAKPGRPEANDASGDSGPAVAPSPPTTPPSAAKGATMSDDISLSDQEDTAVEFLRGLLDAFDVEATVEADMVEDDDALEISVEGEDLGLLVGPRGATLSALAELTRTAVAQQHSGRLEGRLRVDVAGYRARRKEALVRFAGQVADKVRESGKSVALEPMSPPDRKIVHDAVNDLDGVHTSSRGEDRRRHVVIHPDD